MDAVAAVKADSPSTNTNLFLDTPCNAFGSINLLPENECLASTLSRVWWTVIIAVVATVIIYIQRAAVERYVGCYKTKTCTGACEIGRAHV